MTTPNKKLNLETEVVSELTEEQMGDIAGGKGVLSKIISGVLSAITGTETSVGSVIATAAGSVDLTKASAGD